MARPHSAAVTLEKILAAARAEFAQNGFDGARLDAIAKAAGVTKQLVYHYYKSKEELYGVVLDLISRDSHIMLDSSDYDDCTPPEAIALLVTRIMQSFRERPYLAGMMLDQDLHQGEHITRRSQYIPTVRKFVNARMIPIVDRGVAEGFFRPGIDPFMLYWTLFTLATSVFTQAWAMIESCGTDFTCDEMIDRWRTHVVTLVLQGIAAHPDPFAGSPQERPA
ncbi:TetR/AcrR family transcriptional regulator [Novosphingobium sp. CECT 9465]|uniref:TetR/AcrR family transcriptional regulator n=1 Tax=Novosphingobium sp. CECT 9465 TaxID=2829794 RepID=UPI001E53FA22|nr:TetR/AcrR family transcriptional regulator [Novosphingobium sp. CECT 9465]CAH0498340.1 HTH-type transcriptional repressor NicS [Novosphingobium sp. CECT 9465]